MTVTTRSQDLADDRPAISVLFPTTRPWREVQDYAETLISQVEACGGELLVLSGAHAESPFGPGGATRWISAPGRDVFDLRALGMDQARAELVAITEDHVRVGPDWCRNLFELHATDPEAAAFGGPVSNGTAARVLDWANFLLTFAPFLPPINGKRPRRSPTIASAAFVRGSLPAGPLEPGDLELRLAPALAARGLVRWDDSISVTHFQSHGLRATLGHHFANGRCATGLLMGSRSARLRRSLESPPRMVAHFLRSVAGMRGKPGVGLRQWASLPAMALLAIAGAAGRIVGAFAGPGRGALSL